MATNGPIFICGTSRSGTSLLLATLTRHPDVGFANETHYFDDLRVRLRDRLDAELTDEEMRICQDYFLSIAHRPYGHQGVPGAGWLGRDALEAERRRCGNGPDAYFEAFCRASAERQGKCIWGEKTPRHVFRLVEMLSRFQDARAIFMLRDPRAVVASYRDWKNQGGFDFDKDPGHEEALAEDHRRAQMSYHPVTIALLWRSALNAAREAQRVMGSDRVRIVRYEQLVESGGDEERELFRWLGLHPPAHAEPVPMRNSSYESFSTTSGFQNAPVSRWRTTLSASEIAVVEQCAGSLLRSSGYEPISSWGGRLGAARYWLTAIPAIARAAHVNAARSGSLPKYVWRRARLLLGTRGAATSRAST